MLFYFLFLGYDAEHTQGSEEETAGRHTDPESSEAPANLQTLRLLNRNVIKCDICQSNCTNCLLVKLYTEQNIKGKIILVVCCM